MNSLLDKSAGVLRRYGSSMRPFSVSPRLVSGLPAALAIVVLLVATATRLHLLGAQSLWNDEGNSYVQATRSLGDIGDHASRDIHPPGYYWLLAAWMQLTGESEFALRALSAFASVLTVAFTYALGVRLFGRLSGLAAAAFAALNTFNIYYAQEARMYALLALWAVASMWVFAGFVKKPTASRALALGWLNAAGLYTQYAFPFVLVAQGLLLAAWITPNLIEIRRGDSDTALTVHLARYYLAANLLTLVLYAPWLPTAWRQVTTWPNTGQPIPTVDALSKIIAYFAYGITVGSGTTIMVVFFALFGLLMLPKSPSRSWFWVLVPVAWFGIAVGAFLLLELFREANLKLLLPTQIAFALWLGRGVAILWNIEPRRTDSAALHTVPKVAATLGTFALLIGIGGGLNALYHGSDYQRDDYRAIAAVIEAEARSGDAIVLAAPNQQEVFEYYYTGAAPIYPLPRGLGGDDAATLKETRKVIASRGRIFAVLWGLAERDPNNIVENTLDSEAFEAGSAWYGGVRLVRYATPVEFAVFHESGARFGDAITLERFAVQPETAQPGDVVQVQLIWSADAWLDARYKVFVQLLDAERVLVAQHDAEPGGGLYPTPTWIPGETITDNHALIIPDDLPPAHYELILGWYHADDPNTRLPVTGADGAQDHITLAFITLTAD